MNDIHIYIEVAKVVWPIAAWVAWVNYSVRQHQRDIDNWYYLSRGKQGKRDNSLRARVKRATYKLRSKKDGNGDRTNIKSAKKADQPKASR